MKHLVALSVLSAASLTAIHPYRDAELTADERAVRAAIEDYVLGFYEADPERLRRSLSPDMKKMGFWRPAPGEDYRDAAHMTFEEALALAAEWNSEDQQGTDLAYSIELHEVADKTACGKLTAMWGQDYFQLAKEDDRWRIHHVMWQSAPPERAAVSAGDR